jgi:hypothetical protein
MPSNYGETGSVSGYGLTGTYHGEYVRMHAVSYIRR